MEKRTAKLEKTLERVTVVTTVTIAAVAVIAFWKVIAAFMWACYYAGIPM